MGKITFIVGGVRSGKSLYAEQVSSHNSRPKLYIATAQGHDDEMEKRIGMHKLRRGSDWETSETPLYITKKILSPEYKDSVILVDCLTLWLSNLLHHEMDIPRAIDELVDALKITEADVILVSNEVGFGIMPENALARRFADFAGILHQMVALAADEVVMVVAGIPVTIKNEKR